MATIITRAGKGSGLTSAEIDANFTALNDGKFDKAGGTIAASTRIANPGANLQLAWFNDDDAGYLFQGSGRGANLAKSAYMDASGNLIATNAAGSRISIGDATMTFATFSGATVGQPVSTVTRMTIDESGASVTGNFTASGNVTAYSDARLKDDIAPIGGALDRVCAINGVTFTMRATGERGTGLIAQEVRAVLPEAVLEAEDEQGTLSVAYGNLVGLLVEAIKELRAEVAGLRAKVGG